MSDLTFLRREDGTLRLCTNHEDGDPCYLCGQPAVRHVRTGAHVTPGQHFNDRVGVCQLHLEALLLEHLVCGV